MSHSIPQLSFFKTCTTCGETKLISEFHKQGDNVRPACKACTNAQNRSIYEKNKSSHLESKRRYRLENPDARRATVRKYEKVHADKRLAHRAVKLAIKSGRMLPASERQCDCCHAPAETYHHWSYEREHWLDVTPLCRACHGLEHRKEFA